MSKITRLDDAGKKFIMHEEGVILHPYKDSKGIPTIGVGCTYYEDGTPVKMTDPAITMERAMKLFVNISKKFEDNVVKSVKSEINQNQFNSLVSISFNIGNAGFSGSTLLKRVNANPNDPLITEAFKMWKKAGNDPVELLPRRIREANLYFS